MTADIVFSINNLIISHVTRDLEFNWCCNACPALSSVVLRQALTMDILEANTPATPDTARRAY